jgi:hypothetical protein
MDATSRTTAYLWAMIQVHREMKNIRSRNFRGHPAVAPVITLHVFKTRVTLSAFDTLSDALKSIKEKLTVSGGCAALHPDHALQCCVPTESLTNAPSSNAKRNLIVVQWLMINWQWSMHWGR